MIFTILKKSNQERKSPLRRRFFNTTSSLFSLMLGLMLSLQAAPANAWSWPWETAVERAYEKLLEACLNDLTEVERAIAHITSMSDVLDFHSYLRDKPVDHFFPTGADRDDLLAMLNVKTTAASQTEEEKQTNNRKQSNAIIAMTPKDTFSKPYLLLYNGENSILIPYTNPDPVPDTDTHTNYNYDSRIKHTNSMGITSDVILDVSADAFRAIGVEGYLQAALFLAGKSNIEGTDSYYSRGKSPHIKPWVEFAVGLNSPSWPGMFAGLSIVANFNCTAHAICRTQSIRSGVVINGDLAATFTDFAIRGIAKPAIDYMKIAGSLSRNSEELIRLAHQLESLKSEKADAIRLGDAVNVARLKQDIVVTAEAIADARKMYYVPAENVTKLAARVAKAVGDDMGISANGDAATDVRNRMLSTDQFQAGFGLICDVFTEPYEAAPWSLGCVNESIFELQLSATWYDQNFATNPNSRITQGFHGRSGTFKGPDILGINIVEVNTTGVFGGVTGIVYGVEGKVKAKARLNSFLSYGVVFPQTTEGGLEFGKFRVN